LYLSIKSCFSFSVPLNLANASSCAALIALTALIAESLSLSYPFNFNWNNSSSEAPSAFKRDSSTFWSFCLLRLRSSINCSCLSKVPLIFSISLFASSAESAELRKASTNNPTKTINAPIPVDIRAALNVWAPVAPAVNQL